MKRNRFFTLFVSATLSLILLSCSNQKKAERNEITVSILPYKFFAEQLTGGKVKVNCMLTPGDNHATYQPSPRQIEGLERSAVYFSNGYLVFEDSWLPNIQSNNPDLEIVDCSKGVRILEGHHHEEHDHQHHDHSNCSTGGDPHYWTLPSNAISIVGNMYEAISRLELIERDTLEIHYDHLLLQLKTLSEKMDTALSSPKRTQFMIYHPALSYISHHYGFEQVSIEQEGKSPSVAQLKTVLDMAKESGMKHVLIQKQFDQDNASLIAQEIDGEILSIDPLAYDYINSTLDLSQKLQKVLND